MRRASLLVVDDNEANRDVLSRRLALKGYDVTTAADGAEALARVEGGAYDLLLLDVEMPGISGLDVLTAVRERRSSTDLPVIMVTARASGDNIVEAFRLGANDYVTKPIDFPVALARIGTHLSLKYAGENLRESEERYALAMQGANDGLWDWNLVTNEVYRSERWMAMLGYAGAEIGTSPDEWLGRIHADDRVRVKDALDMHMAGGATHFECEYRVLHRNGTFRWVLCRGAAIRNAAGVATRIAGSLTDVTDAKVSDPLTGLPNHVLFADLLDRVMKRAERRSGYMFALLVLSVDRFARIGDSLGAVAADRLLAAVAIRLQTSLRATDAVTPECAGATLARYTSDEFTVLLDDISDDSDAVRVAHRLQAGLAKAFDIDGQQVFVSATVGIAANTIHYQRPDEILRDATTALHRAQTDAHSSCELFDPVMRDRARRRLQLETDLRNAVDQDAFVVHYQPIVSVASGRIAGFESLVRWRHPTEGILAPSEFIPLAEDTRLIVPIGRMVLRESCRQMATWRRAFGAAAPDVMCVNVSSQQFLNGDLAAEVEAALAESGLEPSNLKLEITESACVADVRAAQATMMRLQAIGVEWSMDDFGTGYSSLSHLHQLHVDTVKIDRSFVGRIGGNEGGAEMVRVIIGLARNLSMDVVAEGVERDEHLAYLRTLGCEYAQGFYFSRPVDSDAADRLIAAQPWVHETARHGAARLSVAG